MTVLSEGHMDRQAISIYESSLGDLTWLNHSLCTPLGIFALRGIYKLIVH